MRRLAEVQARLGWRPARTPSGAARHLPRNGGGWLSSIFIDQGLGRKKFSSNILPHFGGGGREAAAGGPSLRSFRACFGGLLGLVGLLLLGQVLARLLVDRLHRQSDF